MRIFLYGTLRHLPLLNALLQHEDYKTARAQLSGFQVQRVADSTLPTIRHTHGGFAEGLVVDCRSSGVVERLDAYELPFGYVSREVPFDDAGGVRVYFPPSEQVSSEQPWDLDAWVKTDGALSTFAAEEIGAQMPALTGDQMGAQWPMIRARASARARANNAPHPSHVRHEATKADWTLSRQGSPAGAFFRFQPYDVTVPKFGSDDHQNMVRECFHGPDAALVLPFDAERGLVLLVEQFRTGPAGRGDTNPWTLEPVAGMVDADETPETAARRECLEEADIVADTLIPAFNGYPTPGAATDYFYCYLAPCNLAQTRSYYGGLESEHEDLRLHILPIKGALELITTGEINVLPLIAMLYALEKHLAKPLHSG